MYYRPGDIIRHLGSGTAWDANIAYSIERKPLGTFGGVKKNEGFLNETFVVASGDVLADVNFLEIYEYHKKKKAIATIALTTTDNPTEYGIVGLHKDGRIERFLEKPAPEEVFSNLINAGIYVMEPEVFELFPSNSKMDFSRTLFPALLEAATLFSERNSPASGSISEGPPILSLPTSASFHAVLRPTSTYPPAYWKGPRYLGSATLEMTSWREPAYILRMHMSTRTAS